VEDSVQFDWFTFVSQIINFLILIWLLQRFLFKPINKAMAVREQKIISELEEARQTKLDAEQQEQELKNRLNQFEEQKDELLGDARRHVEEKRKQWLDDLRAEMMEVRNRWEEALETEKKLFLDQLSKETAAKIIDLIERVLQDLSERNLEEQTVDYFCERLEQLTEEKKQQLQKNIQAQQVNKVEINSSFPFTGDQKHKLTNLLRQVTQTELEIAFKKSDELGFGMEIHLKGWSMTWNLARYIEQLAKEIDQFLVEQSTIDQAAESESVT
jgi:F-type H+-transporting ATPase subunit b